MTILLFRTDLDSEKEIEVAKKYFKRVETQRARCRPNPPMADPETVIGRFSVLPFYKETERDLQANHCQLINTFRQHNFIADLREWYEVLQDYTPKTWFRVEDVPEDFFNEEEEGTPPRWYVVKGATNSRKELWHTHMVAVGKREVIYVAGQLMNDTLIGSQPIYVREFVKFKLLDDPDQRWNTAGAPLTEEYRFFIYKDQIVASGFYWQSRLDELVNGIPTADKSNEMIEFVNKIIGLVGDSASFYVIDVGVLDDGGFTVVELNDGQMSGLSCIEPEFFYKRLAKIEG